MEAEMHAAIASAELADYAQVGWPSLDLPSPPTPLSLFPTFNSTQSNQQTLQTQELQVNCQLAKRDSLCSLGCILCYFHSLPQRSCVVNGHQ